MNKSFLSNEALSIAVRDFLKNLSYFRGKISSDKYHSLKHLQMYNLTILDVLHEILSEVVFILPTRESIFKLHYRPLSDIDIHLPQTLTTALNKTEYWVIIRDYFCKFC